MLANLPSKTAPDAIDKAPLGRPDRLHLNVIFTDPEGTRGALSVARELGRGLNTYITLLVPQVVPYPLPLDEPAVASRFTQTALTAFLTGQEGEIDAAIYLCRDRVAAIREALFPRSLVILGGRTRWWRTPAERLARTLQRDRHKVIFVDSSQKSAESATPVQHEIVTT